MINGKTDPFLQSSCEHLVLFELLGTDTGAVQRVATIEIASVSPVQQIVLGVELQINWFRQVIDQQLNIRAVFGLLICPKFKQAEPRRGRATPATSRSPQAHAG